MSLDDDTRRRLLAAKAVGIVRSRGLVPAGEPQPLMGGAATLVEGGGAWVLVQRDATRAVGASLAWSLRQHAAPTTCVIDVGPDGRPQLEAARVVAAKAAALASPPDVLAVVGSTLEAVEPRPLPTPGPHEPAPAAAPRLKDAEAAQVDVVVHQDGALTFEVLGLEVARVAVDGTMSVGAGKHDRDATSELYGDQPTREALVRAAEVVRQQRRADAQPGPATFLQRERWLRGWLAEDPARLAAAGVAVDGALVPVAEPSPPADLRQPRPAAATADGGRMLVVCSAGIDLDLVPTAAWLRAWAAPAAEQVVLVVPTGDDKPILHDMAPLLPVPATVVAVDPPWEDDRR
jgi:hypothetical protein